MTVVSRARNGTRSRTAPTGVSVRDGARFAPFGAPVVPLVRITKDEGEAGRGSGTERAAGDQRVERVGSRRVLGPRSRTTERAVDARHDAVELLVVHESLDAFPRAGLVQLRSREVGVEQHRPSTELRAREEGVVEAPVVAHENPDSGAGRHAALAPGVGQPGRALVQIGERERPSVVDQRGPPTVTHPRADHRPAERAIPALRAEELAGVRRRLSLEEP